jgi:hypothetical protein
MPYIKYADAKRIDIYITTITTILKIHLCWRSNVYIL